MRRFPVQVWGPSYHDRSLPYSAQSTINLYPGRPVDTARSIRALHYWPGALELSAGPGSDRGMGVHKKELYKVSGTTLEKIDFAGARTSLGTVSGTGRCQMASDGTNLVIATGEARYQYNGTLSLISDASHEPGYSAAFLNRQMIYDGKDGSFWVADVNDPDSINALNFATAESRPDDSIAAYAFRNNMVFIFGEESVEGWYNDATASNPAYTRVDGSIHPIGAFTPWVVADDRRAMYFLGHDRHIYRMVDFDLQKITPVAMETFLETEDLTDSFGICINYGGQYHYILTCPNAGCTWGIPVQEPINAFKLSTGIHRGRYMMNDYAYCYGKHLVSDYRSGNVYELNEDTLTDNGETRLVERALGPINAEALGQTGAEITMNRFEYIMETGVGIGDTPAQAHLDLSLDGGASWTNERWVSLGEEGQKATVRHDAVKTAKDIIPRIRITDPVKVSIHSSAIHARLTGSSL